MKLIEARVPEHRLQGFLRGIEMPLREADNPAASRLLFQPHLQRLLVSPAASPLPSSPLPQRFPRSLSLLRLPSPSPQPLLSPAGRVCSLCLWAIASSSLPALGRVSQGQALAVPEGTSQASHPRVSPWARVFSRPVASEDGSWI